MLLLPGAVILQCKKTNGGVVAAGCVRIERLKTNGRVSGAPCEVEEGIIARRGVLTGIASNRWGAHRLRCGRKRKAGEHEEDETESKPRRRPADCFYQA